MAWIGKAKFRDWLLAGAISCLVAWVCAWACSKLSYDVSISRIVTPDEVVFSFDNTTGRAISGLKLVVSNAARMPGTDLHSRSPYNWLENNVAWAQIGRRTYTTSLRALLPGKTSFICRYPARTEAPELTCITNHADPIVLASVENVPSWGLLMIPQKHPLAWTGLIFLLGMSFILPYSTKRRLTREKVHQGEVPVRVSDLTREDPLRKGPRI